MDVDSSCTSNSMYLSFDAESTISSAMFKTLEASTLSTIEQGENENDDQDVHNTTLEANVDESDFKPEHVMSHIEIGSSMSPLRPIVHNKLMQQYKALCSTPSKEQLKRGVNITRGSAMEQCIILNMPILDDIVEESRPESHSDAIEMIEENKENCLPESGEGSSLSMSSSVEVVATTVIEKKITALSISDEENATNILGDATPKIDNGNLKQSGIKLSEVNSILSSNGFNKQRRSLLTTKNVQKANCEPDLKANRPSRIVTNNKKRLSLATPSNVPMTKTTTDKESEIPTLINKMLKIVDVPQNTQTQSNEMAIVAKKTDIGETVVSVSSSRTSKLPTKAVNLGEKRPYSVSQRMSILVKTTLNSPARKMARRSLLVNPQPIRRSILARKFESTESSTAHASSTRRSMLPVSRMVTSNNSKELHAPQTNRKSLHSHMIKALPKSAENPGLSNPPMTSKLEPPFNCTICGSKFTLKSLLDAHKRSHEDSTLLLVRKPSSASVQQSVSNNGNEKKCKFCDKKFALVRALHIHLLQNCAKIPPKEKRKLQYTELNHVEKAQLPPVFHGGSTQATTHSIQQQLQSAHAIKKLQSNLSSAPATSAESLIDKGKDITVLANELVAAVDGVLTKIQPPQYGLIKKNPNTTAHAGVYRTPSKAVPCHLCKKTFKNVLEYTNHSMTMHSVHNDDVDNSNKQML